MAEGVGEGVMGTDESKEVVPGSPEMSPHTALSKLIVGQWVEAGLISLGSPGSVIKLRTDNEDWRTVCLFIWPHWASRATL